MLSLSLIQKITVWIVPLLLAITVHEAAHSFMAYRLGDNTAKMLGRLSLNPLKHLDWWGTLVVPILIAIVSQFQFVFGWAKPVPIDWRQLKNPRRDSALVALAGPGSNFIMAFLWALTFKLATFLHPQSVIFSFFLLLTAQAGVLINLVFALLNLIPIPPLDGSRILASLLPPRYAYYYARIEPFGLLILIVLLLTGILNWLLLPLLVWCLQILSTFLHL